MAESIPKTKGPATRAGPESLKADYPASVLPAEAAVAEREVHNGNVVVGRQLLRHADEADKRVVNRVVARGSVGREDHALVQPDNLVKRADVDRVVVVAGGRGIHA